MSRDYEPQAGQWYEDLDNEEAFQVLSVARIEFDAFERAPNRMPFASNLAQDNHIGERCNASHIR